MQRSAACPVMCCELDGLAHRLSERFEHVGREIHQIDDLRRTGLVLYAPRLGGLRGTEFIESEVHSDLSCHRYRLYESLHWYRPSVSSPPAPAQWLGMHR